MTQHIKIAVIGSTGKSGKYVLKQLLQHGYACRLLLRNPERFGSDNPLIEIVKGDVRNYNDVAQLLQGCKAVVSTLSQTKDEPPVFAVATQNILAAMQQQNINRYIAVAGINVNAPGDEKDAAAIFATEWMYKNYPVTTAARQAEYEALVASDIDWTLVRLPVIEQTDDKPAIKVNLVNCPGKAISATSLGNFIAQQLFNRALIKKAPFIANE